MLPEQPDTAIEDMDMFRHWLVLHLRHRGLQRVAALPLQAGLPAGGAEPQLLRAPLPDWALSVVGGANAEFEASTLRLQLSSPVHPEVTLDWEMGSQQLASLAGEQQVAAAQQQAAQGSQDSAVAAAAAAGEPPARSSLQRHPSPKLGWRQLWARSADGAEVPLTLAGHLPPGLAGHGAPDESSSSSGTRSVSQPRLEPRPCLLVVYGSYGHNLPTEFLAERLPLLRRGWLLALAHVRGGGELGRRWHAAGRGAAKHKSVDDLEACLDLLLRSGGCVTLAGSPMIWQQGWQRRRQLCGRL